MSKTLEIREMWDYQQIAFDQVMEHLEVHNRALMVMATGLGKSVVAGFVTKELLSKGRVLCLCHEAEILKHLMKVFKEVLGEEVTQGIFYGERKDCEEVDILFATFQTFRTWCEAFHDDEFALIIVDESHHSEATTYRPVLDYFSPEKLLGITATPDRMDEKDIRDIFGEPVVNIDLFTALHQNWLPFVEYHVLTDGLDQKKLRALLHSAKEGNRQISIKQVNETVFIQKRDDEIAEIIKSYGKKQTVIFCENILHADEFCGFLTKAKVYHSGMSAKENAETLEQFKSGELQYILAVDKLNEGVDMPDAEMVVFLRSTDSWTIFIQQLGRCLRKKENKLKVVVLDFVANCERIFMIKKLSQDKSRGPEIDETILRITGAGFDFIFSDELIDVLELVRHIGQKRNFYLTWEEASAAARKLGITTHPDYGRKYKADPLLPAHPDRQYSVWEKYGKWIGFLGTNSTISRSSEVCYSTWEEASLAAKKLEIRSSTEYHIKYRLDPKLPSKPYAHYPAEWKKFNRWIGFLGTNRKSPFRKKVKVKKEKVIKYANWEEASVAAQRLGIVGVDDYRINYKKDPKLPATPNRSYGDVWKKNKAWFGFLGLGNDNLVCNKRDRESFYQTWEEAAQGTRSLGIKSSKQYRQGAYKKDPKLFSAPWDFYGDVWKQNGGWPGFLGKLQ